MSTHPLLRYDRIKAIERSLRCFVYGWLALIPLLGIGPAVLAIRLYRRVRRDSIGQWNPARAYLIAGHAMGWMGLAVPGIVLLWIVGKIWSQY